jgi:acetyl esterase/lipase
MPYITHRLLAVSLVAFTLTPAQAAQEPAVEYQTERDIAYYARDDQSDYMREQCRLDVYYPAGSTGFQTVVWFHGGGLTSGEKSIPKALQNKGLAVVAVNYRLSPHVKCPAYLEDAAAAVAWVFQNIERYGGSPDRIVVSGHSAGGYLTAMIGLDKRWLSAHDIDANRIATLVPFSGHTITHMTIRAERGISDKQPVVDEFAPLWHVRADAPPLHLIAGDRDLEMLGRYEEIAYFWRMMKVVGHQQTYLYELDGFDHGGMAEPGFALLLKIMR